MKRLILLLVIAASAVVAVHADVDLVVWQTDGTTTRIPLRSRPTFGCGDSIVVIRTADVEVEYPLAGLRKFTFADAEETSVTPLTKSDVKPARMVFDINGRPYSDPYTTLDDLPRGIWIVRDGDVSYKVVRR